MLNINNPRIRQPILGRWNLTEEIGRGRHGVVYLAQDSEGYVAAVKIISLPNEEIMEAGRAEFGDDRAKMEIFVGQIAQKFGNEVESMRVLSSSCNNIIRLYDNYVQQNGIYWDIILVMEYAVPLKKYFKNRPLRICDVIDFARDVALGFSECEKRHIIHRDIKEDNLFIGMNNGIGKIGDFGVASINTSGLGSTIGMGTPYYMAPEVATCKHYDNTVDIYSLGIVLYKMLNGNRFPFVSDSMDNSDLNRAYERRRNGERLSYPRYAANDLGDIVIRCCEYDPKDRFRNGAALYNALTIAAEKMDQNELNRVVPYIAKESITPRTPPRTYSGEAVTPPRPQAGAERSVTPSRPQEKIESTAALKDYPDKSSQTDAVPQVESTTRKTDWLMSTISIIQSIINKEGRNSTIARGFTDVTAGVDRERYNQQREQYKKTQRMRIIIIVSICVALLAALLVFLYPRTATFYVDTGDNSRIHVKYLFLPDRRKANVAASYLSVEGNWMYYSNPEEDHSMYKLSIWGGKPILLCEDDCEYDILIDGYIYYTHYDDGEKLYRIKTDGTGREKILDYACRDLRRNGKNIMFKLVDTGELMELDTTTI